MDPQQVRTIEAIVLAVVLVSAGTVFLAGGAALAADQREPSPTAPMRSPEHVEVDPETTCRDCHREVTPEVHEAWLAGPHGVNNVLCFTCHGSTGDDFRLRPEPERCAGCHPGQVGTLSGPEMEALEGSPPGQKPWRRLDCFACHPPHRLNPHAAMFDGGTPPEPDRQDTDTPEDPS